MNDSDPNEKPPEVPTVQERVADNEPTKPRRRDLTAKLLFAVCALLVACRLFGLLRPFKIPTSAMAPTVEVGDHVAMEGFSYLFRSPQRGDILVFKTEGIPSIPQDQIYTKRTIGIPGDKLAMIDGILHLNSEQCLITNALGESKLVTNSMHVRLSAEITVPENEYFVIGDNHPNSTDSLVWGTVPGDNVLGRLCLRYWPLNRLGPVY